jgi:hypothetical protein
MKKGAGGLGRQREHSTKKKREREARDGGLGRQREHSRQLGVEYTHKT